MRLYSYVVARDYGFAPNPFFGVCTLATCKPKIRSSAKIGDFVVGTGSANYGLVGHLVFAMRVSETSTYDRYWDDPRFQKKKPNLKGSLKQAFGDNIYRHNPKTKLWCQANSHHSHHDGTPNPRNIEHDTKSTGVLIASDFVYFGGAAPRLPTKFQSICTIRGHKSIFPENFVAAFEKWFQTLPEKGYVADPAEF